ncbi:MAG: hypothetical protein HQM15_11305 [Deltaproteobacteria bacterium]|nr:hypothetical protein [Deltaproteobacteria bacterium]
MKLLSRSFQILMVLVLLLAGWGGSLKKSYAEESSPEASPADTPKDSKEEPKKEEPKAAKKPGDSLLHGWIMENYRWQTTGDNSNNLTETLVTLNIGDPTMHRYSGSIEAGLFADLNSNDLNSPYHNVYDSFSSRAVGRLYSAYLDVNKVNPFGNIRIGRQHLYELENLNFDGISLESKAYYGFVLSGFAGVPVHLYENQLGEEAGDWTAGASLQWTPVSRLRFRSTFEHLHDKIGGYRITEGKTGDSLIGNSVWLKLTSNWDLYSKLTLFSDQLRNWEFSSSTRFPKQDLRLDFSVYRLLKAYDFRVLESDPLSVAGTYEPYTEFQARIYKGFGKKFSFETGASVRKLDDEEIAGAFNHGYERVYGTLSTRDFLIKGFSTSTAANYYHGEDSVLKNNYFGLNFSLNQQLLKKRLTVGAGTAYYLYRYNLFTGDVSNNVRTYFAEVEGKIRKDLKLKTTYEFEKNAINGFHSGRVRLVWDF